MLFSTLRSIVLSDAVEDHLRRWATCHRTVRPVQPAAEERRIFSARCLDVTTVDLYGRRAKEMEPLGLVYVVYLNSVNKRLRISSHQCPADELDRRFRIWAPLGEVDCDIDPALCLHRSIVPHLSPEELQHQCGNGFLGLLLAGSLLVMADSRNRVSRRLSHDPRKPSALIGLAAGGEIA